MKSILSAIFGIAIFLLFADQSFADGTNAVIGDLNVLVGQINTKIVQGQSKEKDFADELKAFEILYAKYKDLKTEDVAQILSMKAQLYMQLFNEPEKAAEAFQQIKRELPETETGKRVDSILDSLKMQIQWEQIRSKLAVGSKFPDFNEKDLAGEPLSIANHKGKVVLLDFWATWCAPCMRELPAVLKVYEKYHKQGFEIIGISLDNDRTQLEKVIKDRSIPWQQFFNEKGGENKLAVMYGIYSIPATFLLDGEGKIIATSLHGDELEAAVAKALGK